MKVKLTPGFVREATMDPKDETAGRSLFWDSTLRGFGLMVTKGGHKSYVAQYRTHGRSRRYTINSVLNLEAARKEAKGVLGMAAKGGDPLADRQRAAAEPANTFKAIATAYLDREGKRLRSGDERKQILERLVFPKFGERQAESIRTSEIVKLLDKIEDENGPRMADVVLAIVRRVFNWHEGRSDDFRSPIRRGMARQKPSEHKRERILTDDELRAIWTATEKGGGAFDYYVRFLLLTATRRNEAADMARAERDGSDWVIPADRYKTKLDHLVPMSGDAVALLDAMPNLGKFVFSTDGKRSIGGFSKFKSDLDKRSGVTGWTLHDLRRTARSLMSRAGVPSDHAERALGHVLGGVRATYDRYEYKAEKAAAFEALALQVRRILNPAENVVDLRAVS